MNGVIGATTNKDIDIIVIVMKMKPKQKKNKDEFEIPNQIRIKPLKKQRIQLRNNRAVSRNMIESPQNSDDEEYQQKLVNRGSQWWGKVNHRFFRELLQQQLHSLMQKTTSQQLLSCKYQSKQLDTYFQEQIVSTNPFLASSCFLKVLFRRQVKLDRYQHYELVTYTFKEYNYLRNKPTRIIDRNIHLSSFRYPQKERIDFDQDLLDRVEIDIIDVEDSQDQIKKLLHYDVVNKDNREEVEKEIQLWATQLDKINHNNLENWNQMIKRMTKPDLHLANADQEIAQIKKQLRMTEVLLYFKRGHSDKTEQMLEDALEVAMIKQMNMKDQQKKKRNTKIQKLKCLFQTDCKICFCTQSDDKNQVLYCDSCNTSFHQACYGVQFIQREEKFYCEVCQFIKKNTILATDKDQVSRIPKKPVCQICCKPNFPMKLLNGHFYHITCLVLFDLVQIKNYEIQFKNSYTFESILQRVVQNQMISKYCSFCLRQTGMKFKCAHGNCNEYFHPICAYLNGVHFQLARSYRSLSSTLTCASHYPQRDYLNQNYLRRFFCDYKATSNKTDVEFQQEYKRQVNQRSNLLANKLKDTEQGVKKKGKIFKTYKCNQQRAPRSVNRERSQLGQSCSKKDSSEIASNPLPNNQLELTDTRKLLRKIEKNE